LNINISGAFRSYEAQRLVPVKNTPQEAVRRMSRAEEQQDTVALSARAKEYHTAHKAIANTPDIRADKVEALKAQMNAGTYAVSSADIAEKIYSSALG
jgi:negative regulator of flagellin synthesis FlgM